MPKPHFNPNNALHLQRLYRAIEWNYKQLEPARQHNSLSIRQMAGRFYGDNSEAVKVPVNMVELAYTIYLHHLAGGTPRVHGYSPYRNLRAFALDFELVMNDLLDQIRFVDAQRAAVGNALFSMGIVKVGVKAGENISEYSETPFAAAIGVDNWMHDMTANEWPQVQIMGNKYSLPEEVVKETREFNRKQSGELEATEATVIGDDGNETAQAVGVGMSSHMEEGRLYPCIPLWDIYLPLEKQLVTIDARFILDKPLRVVDLDEEGSVYERLSFCDLDQNTMPLPPSALWMDLHLLANNIFNKLENQAKNSRNITTFTGPEGAKDAASMDATQDGGACHISGMGKPEAVKTTGIDQVNLAFGIQIMDIAKMLWGNLDSIGGLGPQSPTLGQDQMLAAGASQRLAKMQDLVHDFQGRVVKTLAQYEHSGESNRVLSKPVQGTKYDVRVNWNKQSRKQMGPLDKYQVKIAMYSSMGTSPSQKLSNLANLFNTFILPMIPAWQQQGYSVDPRSLVETVARLSNTPELESWIAASGVPLDQTEGQNSMPKSPNTTRKYERINRSQATNKTRDGVMMRTLLEGKPQASEMGSLAGATG